MTARVCLFPTSDALFTFEERNCGRCARMATCDLITAIYDDILGDATVPQEIAQRIGGGETCKEFAS